MKYATEGAFVDLDPYINAYAPNIKKFFEENEWARKGFLLYADNNYCSEQFPDLTFTTEEQRIIKEKETAINTYVSEKMQAWIMGNESPEENFDEYIATVKSMGYDELRTAYQNAYDRYMKQ